MSGTYSVTMGDRGRLVMPAALREQAGFTAGTTLVLIDSGTGIVMMTQEQAREQVRAQLAGNNLVAQLLAERRAAAVSEDAV